MDAWEQIKQKLMTKLTAESFQNWFGGTSLHHADGDTLCVAVPNEATREYIEEVYGDAIRAAIRELKLPFRSVYYELGPVQGDGYPSPANGTGKSGSVFPTPARELNPKFTFDNFVVGSCNQFAHAAARAVASKPARSYNPLFIYGGSGVGKTHLLHATGQALLKNYPDLRVVYTSGEHFMSEMIFCLRTQSMSRFHRHYRSADVLLVDDIHILGGKQSTQDEFFYTFNDLYEHQKQIILSSDSPPKEIPGLVERLRSRFEWGLMADIQPPDLETKLAILEKKAEAEGLTLPEDVRIFIATRTRPNVRDLEGALTRLLAFSSMTEAPITLSMAQQALRYLTHGHEKRITIDAVIRAVAEKFSLQPGELKQKTNIRSITFPRQIAMYLAKELTAASLPELGRAFGGKHHTTVLHSIKKIERERQKNQDLSRLLQNLTDSLH